MDRARYARAKAVFAAALDRPDPERRAFVGAACGEDSALAQEVLSLLGHHRADPILADDAPSTEVDDPLAARSPHDPLGLSGQLLDGRYRVAHFVAEGGFGYVYRAEHVLWRRPLAVKVFKRVLGGDSEEKLKEAFIREGALLNELSRKTTGIVQSHDVGTWRGPQGGLHLFTVLEWLEGRTLASLITAERVKGAAAGWPIERILDTLAPIAEALAVAHGSGVAHRDVKPSNIFLLAEAAGTTAKLLDFGVAKVAGEHAEGFLSTGTGITAFTVEYAAPEQFERRWGTTGPWTDVHALALIAVELLLGRHPITGKGTLQAYLHICNPGDRPTPRTLGAEVSPEVEAVFSRALALKTADRYPEAGAFWRALGAAASPAPVTRP